MSVAKRGMRIGLAWLCLTLLAIGTAAAQDPRASAAQKAARDFLVLTDADNGQASWNAAGKQFQNSITAERWAKSLRQVRSPLGAVTQRTLESTQFKKNFKGAAAEGDYVVLVFRTSFAKKTSASETVTLEHGPDGAWRVIGYYIR